MKIFRWIKQLFISLGKFFSGVFYYLTHPRKILRWIKYYLIRLFRLRSGAHKIALGFVVGFSPCWFPTFGTGPIFSIFLARLFRIDVISAFIAASLGSFVWPFLFIFNLKVGDWLNFTSESGHEDVHYSDSFSFADLGLSFVLGTFFNLIVFSAIGYVILYYLFNRYRVTILRKLVGQDKVEAKEK